MKTIKRLAFVINKEKSGAEELALTLIQIAKDNKVDVIATDKYPIPDNFLSDCDACCVLGGDGTLLGIAAEATRKQVPLIGINQGKLGFLTSFTGAEAAESFAALLGGGGYHSTQRTLLECVLPSGKKDLALNEVLIKDENHSQIAHLEVHADGNLVTDYYCDGLIFATPTGSTAYNLSAGGPLIYPSSKVIAMTPICPHTLSNRSIIFPKTTRLEITSRGDESGLLITIDGQRKHLAPSDGRISITVSPLFLTIIQGADYFSVLRSKLKWSGGAYFERP